MVGGGEYLYKCVCVWQRLIFMYVCDRVNISI